MLDLFNSTAVSAWLSMADVSQSLASSIAEAQNTPWVVAAGEPADPEAQTILQHYLEGLSNKGLQPTVQGVWLQSGSMLLASNQGTTPLPAASLTKTVTSLVSLETWGPDHRFETLISTTGEIQQGVLNGDLVVKGGGDPLLVWEEAFALGNSLNRLGITRVTGNLIITGNFQMNFEVRPDKAGELLKQAVNSAVWTEEATAQYRQLPPGTPQPTLAIAGTVQVLPESQVPPTQTVLVRHESLPVVQILKLMNIYSNNVIAQSMADLDGGYQVVAQKAAQLAGVPPTELLLTNGSGLGVENQISPRAICAVYAAIQRYLEARNLTVADLFAIAGTDQGTIEDRKIPPTAVVKTGTLNDVSALAGVLPTRDRGLVWFTIINRGSNLEDLRDQQDALLQALVNRWGAGHPAPSAVLPRRPVQTADLLRSANRDQILFKPAMDMSNPQ